MVYQFRNVVRAYLASWKPGPLLCLEPLPFLQRQPGSGSSGISKPGSLVVGGAERHRLPYQTEPGSKSILR